MKTGPTHLSLARFLTREHHRVRATQLAGKLLELRSLRTIAEDPERRTRFGLARASECPDHAVHIFR